MEKRILSLICWERHTNYFDSKDRSITKKTGTTQHSKTKIIKISKNSTAFRNDWENQLKLRMYRTYFTVEYRWNASFKIKFQYEFHITVYTVTKKKMVIPFLRNAFDSILLNGNWECNEEKLFPTRQSYSFEKLSNSSKLG